MAAPTKLLNHHEETIALSMDRSEQTQTSSPYAGIDNSSGFPAKRREPISLLQLPSEIRNMIYVYALTADGTLMCCVPPTAYPKKEPKFIRTGCLTIERKKVAACPSFNQLQFVNRQLRHETEGLELTFNTIFLPAAMFRYKMRTGLFPVADLLTAFRKVCSPVRFSWLSKIRLQSDNSDESAVPFGYSEKPFPAIADFCKANHHIEVQYVLQDFYITYVSMDRFFIIGAALTLALRNDNSAQHESLPHVAGDHQALSATWADQFVNSFLVQPGWHETSPSHVPLDHLFSGIDNLTIFPRMEVIDEATFATCHYGFPSQAVSLFPKEQQENWLKWAKIWVKDGIKPCL